jgi:hypothetical protein
MRKFKALLLAAFIATGAAAVAPAGFADASASTTTTTTIATTTASDPSRAGSAATLPTRRFKNAQTGRCIDDYRGTRPWTCNGTDAQIWYIRNAVNSRMYENEISVLCMSDGSAGFRTIACNLDGPIEQRWFLTTNSDSSITIQNLSTHRCLEDTLAGGLRTYTCNGTLAQRWKY